MLLKSADSKEANIANLERLLELAVPKQKKEIEQELKNVRSGIKGENDAAYFINHDYEHSKNYVVLHDLRLESRGRVAQIDHLLINRMLHCFVLESKRFHSGIRITEEGEFLKLNNYEKTFEGMASPLQQNQRHIDVLKDVFAEIEMPTRLGMRLNMSFQSFVLISNNARIDRPKRFDTSQVIKMDSLKKTVNAYFDKMNAFQSLESVAKVVDEGTLYAIGRRLVNLHQPAPFSYVLAL